MKKNISILLSVLLISCVLVCGCSNDNWQGGNNSQNNGTDIRNNSNSEDTIIEKKDFIEYCEIVELTKENWKDYFEIATEEKTHTTKDDFGDIVSSTVETKYVLRVKDRGEFTGGFLDVAIELNNLKDGTLKIYKGNNGYEGSHSIGVVNETDTIDDFECTRIKGKLIFAMNVPKDYIYTDNKGREYFDVYKVEGKDKLGVAGDALYSRFYKGTFAQDNYNEFID